jgi:hypothetical protein
LRASRDFPTECLYGQPPSGGWLYFSREGTRVAMLFPRGYLSVYKMVF